MFNELTLENGKPVPMQIKTHIKNLILKGMLPKDEKLPSTRELSGMLGVSRNSVLKAYEELADDGFIKIVNNVGAYVLDIHVSTDEHWEMNWEDRLSRSALIADELDLIKNTIKIDKKVINFRGLAPDRDIFDIDGIKRAFLNIISKEGYNVLNYGYAKGYKPLIDYLLSYMKGKGIDTEGKDIVITNGFTEGFGIVLSTICEEGDTVLCENPTHNTALKIMRMHRLNVIGADMGSNGVDTDKLRDMLGNNKVKAGYLIPSYHNPTGIVTPLEKRMEIYRIFKEYDVPVIEDGFSEELRYSGAHIPPIAALSGRGNGVVYIGSFSKILFPGIRVGWVLADKRLLESLESIKKSSNIHTSFLDQAILYEYLMEGNLEKCIKKSRRIYKDRYMFALECAKEYIENEEVTGNGGLYIFLKLSAEADSRELLKACYERGVIFTPGDIFYVDNSGSNTIRLSFANVDMPDIEKGFKIIGEELKKIKTAGGVFDGNRSKQL
ncbi:MAG: PLP-dependent aminotransferase family protein [Bacillota bacterium]